MSPLHGCGKSLDSATVTVTGLLLTCCVYGTRFKSSRELNSSHHIQGSIVHTLSLSTHLHLSMTEILMTGHINQY